MECVRRKYSLIVVFTGILLLAALFSSQLCMAADVTKGEDADTTKSDSNRDVIIGWDRGEKIESGVDKNRFAVTLYEPNYFLPLTYNSNPNVETYEQDGKAAPNNYEAKFQLSLKMLLWDNIFKNNGGLYGAYTQLSLWQIYDKSSPFRETNYEPELFLKFDTNFNVFGLRNKLVLFGANHQSNGQDGAFSRSWNRIFVEFIASRGNFSIGLKPWYRIPEDDEDDDNPDIEKYLGYGQLYGAYRWKDNVFSLIFRNNLRADGNKGAVELGWSYGLTPNLRIYLQYFNGYGESLIDYNNSNNRIGIGFMVNDWI